MRAKREKRPTSFVVKILPFTKVTAFKRANRAVPQQHWGDDLGFGVVGKPLGSLGVPIDSRSDLHMLRQRSKPNQALADRVAVAHKILSMAQARSCPDGDEEIRTLRFDDEERAFVGVNRENTQFDDLLSASASAVVGKRPR